MLRRNVSLIGVLIASLVFVVGIRAAESDVVAMVNENEITVNEMEQAISSMIRRSGQQVSPSQQTQLQKKNYQAALDRLIDLSLLKWAAEKQNIKVNKEEVDKEIEEIKSNLPNPDIFERILQQSGKSIEDIRQDIREDLKMQKVIEKNVKEPEAITGQEAKAYFDEHPEDFAKAEMVHAKHILLRVDETADPSEKKEAKEKITEIRKDIVNGEITFVEAAKKYSDDSSAQKGGDLGYFQRGRMVPAFDEAAFSLKEGEVSKPVESKFGYHLIKVVDIKKEYADFESDIKEFLFRREKAQATQKYLDSLKEEADIDIVMTQKEWENRFEEQQGQSTNRSIQIPPGALDQDK